MKKVLYIPLDDRPCNYQYPLLLAEIVDELRMIAPPLSMMGRCKRPADIERIWNWLFEQAADADYAILSVDTLVYGNIIQSRIHQRTNEEIDVCLKRFRQLKERCPHLSIEAFNLVARVAGYNDDFEDPAYWKDYGYRIWRYGWLKDCLHRGCAEKGEVEELEALQAEIPAEYLADFLCRREKDARVNRGSVDLVRDGIFSHLVVPKDDTAEYGYAAIDQRVLAGYIAEQNVLDRVMIYPGADEVGSVLLTRVFHEIHRVSPRIYVRYSSTLGPAVIPGYEDRPLQESIKSQITSCGGVMVDTAAESDLLFAVHSPGKMMQECGQQPHSDLSYSTHTSVHELFRYMQYYHQTFAKPIALSDVAYSNGADIQMMRQAQQTGILDILDAYGGWNTAENTNGMCLAHICLHAYGMKHGMTARQRRASQEFLARKVFEDYLFQAILTARMAEEIVRRDPGRSPYNCADIEREVAALGGRLLSQAVKDVFGGYFQGKKVSLSQFALPWDRVHELAFAIRLDGGNEKAAKSDQDEQSEAPSICAYAVNAAGS